MSTPETAPNPEVPRVLVYVDGWNLHRACERAFGHGQLHPLLLGRVLAGERALSEVRYFIGVPDPRVEPENARRRTRQLEFMKMTGVVVIPKKLRYRHEWRFNKWDLPDPRKHEGESRTAEVTSIRQGREKGVDVALALSAFHAAHEQLADVIIIVSADTDLDLIASSVDSLRGEGTNVRMENAVVNTAERKYINQAYAWSHQIDQSVFDAVRDDFDYDNKPNRKARAAFLARLTAGG